MSTPSYRLTQINILPAEYRRKLISTLQLALVLIILLEGAGLYALQQRRADSQDENTRLERDQTRISRSIADLDSLVAEAVALQNEVAVLEAAVSKLKSGQDRVQAQRLDWPEVLRPLVLEMPEGLSLTSVENVGSAFNVAGVSIGSADPVNRYHAQLVRSPQVTRVTIQTMKTVTSESNPPYIVFTMLVEVVPLEVAIVPET